MPRDLSRRADDSAGGSHAPGKLARDIGCFTGGKLQRGVFRTDDKLGAAAHGVGDKRMQACAPVCNAATRSYPPLAKCEFHGRGRPRSDFSQKERLFSTSLALSTCFHRIWQTRSG